MRLHSENHRRDACSRDALANLGWTACIPPMSAACRRPRCKGGAQGRAGRDLGDVLLEQGEERLEQLVVLAEQPGLRDAARVQRRERHAGALVEAAVHLAHGQHVAHLAVLVRLCARAHAASALSRRLSFGSLRATGLRRQPGLRGLCMHRPHDTELRVCWQPAHWGRRFETFARGSPGRCCL